MAQSFNQVTLIGRVGKDPDIRSFQSGDKVANLSLATSESWKDKSTGEKKEKTQWHNVSITNQGLVKVVENYINKGALLLIVGTLETRSYDKNGEKRYVTEVCLRPYSGTLTMLGGKSEGNQSRNEGPAQQEQSSGYSDEFEDEIPF